MFDHGHGDHFIIPTQGDPADASRRSTHGPCVRFLEADGHPAPRADEDLAVAVRQLGTNQRVVGLNRYRDDSIGSRMPIGTKGGVRSGPLGIAVALGGVTAIMLTVAYTFAAARQIFFGPLSPALEAKNLSDPRWTMTVPLAIVAVTSIVLGMQPRLVMDLLGSVLGGI